MSDSNIFDDFIALLDYPMIIITAHANGGIGGCLVAFATQASINPPAFLLGLSHLNHTLSLAHDSTHLAVHAVAKENIDLARLFGTETDDTVNKFDQCTWHWGPHELPILDEAEAWFAGEIVARFDLGDHIGHLLRPRTGLIRENPRSPIAFHDVNDLTPGHPTRSDGGQSS